MPYPRHDVVIAGGGPTGLMLAGELALAGVDVAIVEPRPDQTVEGSRASGLYPRTIEVLDQRGIADRFLQLGTKHYVVPFAGVILDAADRPTRHSYTLALWQARIEECLAGWVSDLNVRRYRKLEVSNFTQHAGSIDVILNDGSELRSEYLVGCDGGRSLVRKTAGIDFPGWDPTLSYLIFEAEMAGDLPLGVRHGERGVYALGRLDAGSRVRGVITEQSLIRGGRPDEVELRAALTGAYGSDHGVRNVTWLSRFTDGARQASTYKSGRVLLAGDAAHVHSPVGGQGLNLGIQDAVNLGWKLAQVVKGISSDSLLETYQAERHPVGASVLKQTLAVTALQRGDHRSTALREMIAETMKLDGPRKQYAAQVSSLDICYHRGAAHPLVGRRMPDLTISVGGRPIQIFELLHAARPVLLNLGRPGWLCIDGWADRVETVDATFDGDCEIPLIGIVTVPAGILIRPDGHVAWVGDESTEGLDESCRTWFGDPARIVGNEVPNF